MIIAFVGTPGSGKSYDAVREIVNNLRLGRTVYTNVEGMDIPECRRFLQDFLGFDDFDFNKRFYFVPDSEMVHFWDLNLKSGSLLVIDEVHKLFSGRDYTKEKNKKFADWCSTHRHHGHDVYLVTQDLAKVESHVRSLVEWTYIYRKLNFLGGLSKNRYIKYAYSGDDTRGKPLNTISRLYDKRVFKCYKSMVNDTNVKLNIMPQVNVLKHPVFFAIPIVLGLFIYMFFSKSSFATGDLFGTEKVMKNHTMNRPPQPSVAPARPDLARPVLAPVAAVSPGAVVAPPVFHQLSSSRNLQQVKIPVLSNSVHVIGVIANDGSQDFFLLLSDGRSVPSKKKLRLGAIYQD